MPISLAISGLINAALASAPNYQHALSLGVVQSVLLTGRNAAMPTANLADIWGYPAIASGQPVRTLPTAGYSLAIISDSTADVNTSGTGAWTVLISYLDTAYNSHYAVFALNGQTAVTTALSIDGGAGGAVTNALRQNGMEVLTAGTGLVNAGNLYACDSTNTYTAGVPVTTTKVFDFMVAGDNIDSNCAYTVPAGYQGMVLQLIPAINDITATPKFGKCRIGMTTGSNGIFRGFDLGGLSSNNNPVPITPALFPMVPPMSDIRMQGQVSAATEMACVNQLVIWPVVGP